MKYIQPISPANLTLSEVAWLGKGGRLPHVLMEPTDFAKAALKGEMQLWRIEGRGILVTERRLRPGGDELFIQMMAGEGLISLRGELIADLAELARACGCRYLGLECANKKLIALFTRLGFDPSALHMLQEA